MDQIATRVNYQLCLLCLPVLAKLVLLLRLLIYIASSLERASRA